MGQAPAIRIQFRGSPTVPGFASDDASSSAPHLPHRAGGPPVRLAARDGHRRLGYELPCQLAIGYRSVPSTARRLTITGVIPTGGRVDDSLASTSPAAQARAERRDPDQRQRRERDGGGHPDDHRDGTVGGGEAIGRRGCQGPPSIRGLAAGTTRRGAAVTAEGAEGVSLLRCWRLHLRGDGQGRRAAVRCVVTRRSGLWC